MKKDIDKMFCGITNAFNKCLWNPVLNANMGTTCWLRFLNLILFIPVLLLNFFGSLIIVLTIAPIYWVITGESFGKMIEMGTIRIR